MTYGTIQRKFKLFFDVLKAFEFEYVSEDKISLDSIKLFLEFIYK